jgi:hypothetical protein
MADKGRALTMITRVEQMCDFIEHPDIQKVALGLIPVTMPHDIRSHVDISFWVGLGTVGLWAALDAFSERAGLRAKCGTCKGPSCIVPRFPRVQGTDRTSLEELEDLRHLYAHNYAGEADDVYFGPNHTRHVLARAGITLTCGTAFDGQRAQLTLSHLRHYCGVARRVLEAP